MSEKPVILLIDGNALVHRAYHAIPPLTSQAGEPTNATFGFTSMLLKVMSEFQPAYAAVAFDVGRTFRHDQYVDYKATRPAMAGDLAPQFSRVQEIIAAFGIPMYSVEGYEADDVLAALSDQAAEQGLEALIVTGDTDTFQLIRPGVRVLISGRKFTETKVYDEEGIRERYGLEPEQLVDFKALVGDVTDNIPGVKGIGEKTAVKLLQAYGTIEGIYEHLDEIDAPTRAKLQVGEENARRGKQLVQLVHDLPVRLDLSKSRVGDFDRDAVMAIFRELGFRSLVDRVPGKRGGEPLGQLPLFETKEAARPAAVPEALPLGDYRVVDTPEALEDLLRTLSSAHRVALDVETTALDAMRADLVGLSLAAEPGSGYYIPLGHTTGRQLPLEQTLHRLRPVLSDAKLPKVAHNAVYDLTVLAEYGLMVEGLAFDTMIAAWIIDPTGRNIGLKGLAWERLGAEMTPITDLIGKGKAQITIDQVPIERVTPYACADVDFTLRLADILEPELRELKQWDLFANIEMPLVPVLVGMERAGVAIDVPFLHAMSRELHERLVALEKEIQEMVGYPFNINSTQQLGEALFDRLGLPANVTIRGTSGAYSTSAEVLEKLRGKHPVIELILEHRQLSKLKSTYLDALPLLVNPRTGRVHTSFNQTGTVTGRLSSSEPNLQNIPIRTELGRKVRRAFVAREGCLLLGADYSQVELRILAHVSQDQNLLAAFERGEDIHASTAATVLGVPLDKVTPEMRRIAKAVNFGIVYGMSEYGLSQRTELSVEESSEFINNYFARYPRVREYLARTKAFAYEHGYVETLLGRRRYFPELRSDSKAHAGLKRAAERMAINMPIQGTAADIMKIAMIRVDNALREQRLKTQMILQVHDELVFEVPREEMDIVRPLVESTMEGAFKLDAPLRVDIKIGQNWEEMS